jgi:hypothetical protein
LFKENEAKTPDIEREYLVTLFSGARSGTQTIDSFCSPGQVFKEKFDNANLEHAMDSKYLNITVCDLLESFKNDKVALIDAMLVSRVPGNITITDCNAPLIATYLIDNGFAIENITFFKHGFIPGR